MTHRWRACGGTCVEAKSPQRQPPLGPLARPPQRKCQRGDVKPRSESPAGRSVRVGTATRMPNKEKAPAGRPEPSCMTLRKSELIAQARTDGVDLEIAEIERRGSPGIE
jgi:hypothetical protein